MRLLLEERSQRQDDEFLQARAGGIGVVGRHAPTIRTGRHRCHLRRVPAGGVVSPGAAGGRVAVVPGDTTPPAGTCSVAVAVSGEEAMLHIPKGAWSSQAAIRGLLPWGFAMWADGEELQRIKALLSADLVPVQRATRVAGRHGDEFVAPGCCLGPNGQRSSGGVGRSSRTCRPGSM